jgi:hypothetical protein
MRAPSLRCLGPLLLVACGGASGASSTQAKSASRATPTADDVSIGDTALAQGGIDALGGGRNRSAADSAASIGSLRFDRVVKDSPVKLDGQLREWPARTGAKTVLQGDGAKTAFAVALQYDDARLYVGGEVGDDAFMRTSLFKDTEDHAVFTIAFPVGTGAQLAAYDLAIFAGEPGETAGVVRFASGGRRGQEVPGAKIVEAPAQGGYTFEVAIPWSAFAEGRTTRVGLRGAARYVDADAPNHVRAVVGTSDGDAAHASKLPAIPTDPEIAVIEQLLAQKGVAAAPRFDLVADVAGDAMKERIAVYDRFLTICGPHYRDGEQFFFREIAGDLVRLDARAVTGRGKEDLFVTRKYDVEGSTREVFEVWSVLKGSDEPQTAFAHEIAVVQGPKHVDDSVHWSGRDIEVTYEPATGWDAASYREPTSSDVEPIVTPWGAVKSQAYRFDGAKFTKVREVAQTPAPGAAVASAAPAPKDTYANTLAEARKQEPPTPAVTKGGDLAADMLAQVERDRGVPAGTKPRFDMSVNVAGDARPERVVLVGRDIAVFGPGFKGGTGYASVNLSSFASDEDIHEVSARDLTGDGAADVVVRGVRRVTASGVPGGSGGSRRAPPRVGTVDVETMLVYRVDGDQLTRVFGIETGREAGNKRVQGLVQFVPSEDHRSFEIDVRPGLARGWNAKTYPWQQEQPGGTLEPLLLPWGGVSAVRYAWDGSRFSVKN